MPKDGGLEHTLNTEYLSIPAWQLNSSDHRSGICMICLNLKDSSPFPPTVPCVASLQSIWSEEFYSIITSTPDLLGKIEILVVSNADPNKIFSYIIDQSQKSVSFINQNPKLNETESGDELFDPTEENLEATDGLEKLIDLMGLPKLADATKREIVEHIKTRVVEERAQETNRKITRASKDEERTAQRLVDVKKAIEVYDNIIYPALKELNVSLFSTSFDETTFPNRELMLKLVEKSRLHIISEIVRLLGFEPDFFENPTYIEYIKKYLASATLAHNKSVDLPVGVINHVSRSDKKLIDSIGIKANNNPLSATIVSPETKKFQTVGTGWGGTDRQRYLLHPTEFGGKAIAFMGDIDDDQGDIPLPEKDQNYVMENCLTLQDATLLQAIYDLKWEEEFLRTGRIPPIFGYNEVLIFSQIDWRNRSPVST